MNRTPQAIHPGKTVLWDGRFILSLPADAPAGLTLQPLGADGLAALRHMGGSLAALPRAAASTLPSLWLDGHLCFTPFAAWPEQPPARWLAGAAARFVNHCEAAT